MLEWFLCNVNIIVKISKLKKLKVLQYFPFFFLTYFDLIGADSTPRRLSLDARAVFINIGAERRLWVKVRADFVVLVDVVVTEDEVVGGRGSGAGFEVVICWVE